MDIIPAPPVSLTHRGDPIPWDPPAPQALDTSPSHGASPFPPPTDPLGRTEGRSQPQRGVASMTRGGANIRGVARQRGRGFTAGGRVLRPRTRRTSTSAAAAAMASRLLRVSGALRLLPAAGARDVPVRGLAAPGRLATDEEQATGLERKVMEAINKGLDPYSMFRPKRYAGTKEDPNLVPSITNKRIVGCVCEEDNSYVVWSGCTRARLSAAPPAVPTTSSSHTSCPTEDPPGAVSEPHTSRSLPLHLPLSPLSMELLPP
uniref:Cytochrome c oxidase subunit 5B, mitochondrial n=1 Tax=Melopsittacus undulatus TaxID=13146 RepID=A0A8V5H0Q5_MELUD